MQGAGKPLQRTQMEGNRELPHDLLLSLHSVGMYPAAAAAAAAAAKEEEEDELHQAAEKLKKRHGLF